MITLEQLQKIMPKLSHNRALQYLPPLTAAMVEFEINTPLRAAAFLAQLAHESLDLKYFEEIASGADYEGRRDLGNIHEGDGVRYKGRGPIMITGRANYRTAGRALGVDLEGEPHRAADPNIAFRIAGWFWKSRNLNQAADLQKFDTITKIINGGYNGKASRDRYYQRACSVLGVA